MNKEKAMRVYILRGCSGSGKSTLANTICENVNGVVFEADMFFVDAAGYHFDATKLGQAHAWCLRGFESALKQSYEAVVASNTFTTQKELRPYVEACARVGIKPQIISVEGDFGDIHNVPQEAKDRQRQRFDHRAGEILLQEFFPKA
jgi:ABC-type dipeptide/oligopeptide/nickel transport system ATPase component